MLMPSRKNMAILGLWLKAMGPFKGPHPKSSATRQSVQEIKSKIESISGRGAIPEDLAESTIELLATYEPLKVLEVMGGLRDYRVPKWPDVGVCPHFILTDLCIIDDAINVKEERSTKSDIIAKTGQVLMNAMNLPEYDKSLNLEIKGIMNATVREALEEAEFRRLMRRRP